MLSLAVFSGKYWCRKAFICNYYLKGVILVVVTFLPGHVRELQFEGATTFRLLLV